MTTPISDECPSRRPLLAVRGTPGRLALALLRLPLKAYQHHAGPAVGHTFVAFTHLGRRTGRPYQTVAMVLRHDRAGEVVVCAAWGPHTDWYRNLKASPALKVQFGGQTFTPRQRFLSAEESFEVATGFRRAHPRRLRLFSALLGWGDLRDDEQLRTFASTHPFIGFRPSPHER